MKPVVFFHTNVPDRTRILININRKKNKKQKITMSTTFPVSIELLAGSKSKSKLNRFLSNALVVLDTNVTTSLSYTEAQLDYI